MANTGEDLTGGMSTVRVALANLRVPETPEESVLLATNAVAEAGRKGAGIVCFPECYIPGYRWPGTTPAPPDPAFLEAARADVATAAVAAGITVILGTERVTDRGLQITACVIGSDGAVAGWQDKVQLDPEEESVYPAVGDRAQDLHCRSADVRRGHLSRGVEVPRDGAGGRRDEVRRLCFTRTPTFRNPETIVPPRSPTRPTRSMRRQFSVVRRRTRVTSRP